MVKMLGIVKLGLDINYLDMVPPLVLVLLET